MSDLLESINAGFKSRLKNPILGGFIFSWIIINWRPIVYIILSKESIVDRFTYIDDHYLNIYDSLWWPLATSFGIFIGLPYVMAFLDFTTVKGRILRKKQKSYEVENDLKLEISRVDIMQQLEDAKAKYLDRETLNSTIEELKSELFISQNQHTKNEQFRKEYMSVINEIHSIGTSVSRLTNDFLTTEEYLFEGFPEGMRENFHLQLAELVDYLNTPEPTFEQIIKGQEFLRQNDAFINNAENQGLIVFSGDRKNEEARHSLTNWSVNPLGMKTLIMYENELLKKFIYMHLNSDQRVNPALN